MRDNPYTPLGGETTQMYIFTLRSSIGKKIWL